MKEIKNEMVEQSGLIVKYIIGNDRNKAGEILCYILLNRKIENEELYDGHNLISQKITVRYNGIVVPAMASSDHSEVSQINFSAWVKPLKNVISLTNGNVMIKNYNLHGYRIGTYIMNDIVNWAKQWPDAVVEPIKVTSVDASTNTERDRRNKFYEQFGIPFDYHCEEKRGGRSHSIKTENLSTVTEWQKNIEELDISDLFTALIKIKNNAEYKAKDIEHNYEKLKDRMTSINNNPLRYAIQNLIKKALNNLAPIIKYTLIFSVIYYMANLII